MNFIDRPKYLEQLKLWQNALDLVKIVIGVRRSGKSTLFTLFQNDLYKNGVSKDQVININLEDDNLTRMIGLKLNTKTKLLDGYDILLDFIMSKTQEDKKFYIFLDEIQALDNWQRLANTLRLRSNFDVYLTGSNAHMFSSDLANTFGGRYIEIMMYPLSFKEYFLARSDLNTFAHMPKEVALTRTYNEYMAYGGFPQLMAFAYNQQAINNYLQVSVYNNTVQKDIIERFGISDPIRLNKITQYMFDNIGNETSLLNVQKKLKSTGIEISPTTLNTYIRGLLDSYLIYKCERYDLKGKKILESNAKYYCSDLGLRASLLRRTDADSGHALENVVYLELKRRGYEVQTGKINLKSSKMKIAEVDFVATKAGGIVEYYQVAWTVFSDTKVLNRELAPLELIEDNYPKYLLTMDYGTGDNKGIKRINVLDWLMDDA